MILETRWIMGDVIPVDFKNKNALIFQNGPADVHITAKYCRTCKLACIIYKPSL